MSIKLLESEVVHKIAAGEVIVSPANALKELIENSLDAGASSVQVVCKEGGFKLLQISDNGHGIAEEDLPLLCQRFATSKIASFEDLDNVATLGFRGEALASISHVSHLTVRTKQDGDATAIVATYADGSLTGTRKAAGTNGTQINVEDLFYNVPLRLRAFKSRSSNESSEYQKIVDVVSKYAVLYPGTFSCKRAQDSQALVIPAGSVKEKLRAQFGSEVYNNLIEIALDGDNDYGLQHVHGFVTSLNYSSKKTSPYIIFVNRRLVSCDPLARAVRKVYQDNMPKTSPHAVVFLDITIMRHNLDVNVHPTKREVRFLYEQEIVELIASKIQSELLKTGDQRDYSVQSLITSTVREIDPQSQSYAAVPAVSVPRVRPVYEYNMVRTDPLQQRVTHFARAYPSSRPPSSESIGEATDTTVQSEDTLSESPLYGAQSAEMRAVRDLNLASVGALLDEMKKNVSTRLLYLFSQHTLVGVVDAQKGLAAIQHGVRLYLVEYRDVFLEFFYQTVLTTMGNFGSVHLGDGIPISKYSSFNAFHMVDMLREYFQIELTQQGEQWYLTQMPVLLPKYVLNVSRLADFLSDIGEVDFADEKQCIEGVARALARVHLPSARPSADGTERVQTIFNAIKTCFVPSKALSNTVIEIASLPKLYKVFERC